MPFRFQPSRTIMGATGQRPPSVHLRRIAEWLQVWRPYFGGPGAAWIVGKPEPISSEDHMISNDHAENRSVPDV